jgi:hypothetical protein
MKLVKAPGEAEDLVSVDGEDSEDDEVDGVILVRKLAALASLRGRRQDVLKKLEIVSALDIQQTMPSAHRPGPRQIGETGSRGCRST